MKGFVPALPPFAKALMGEPLKADPAALLTKGRQFAGVSG
jgi:hypothetical protein